MFWLKILVLPIGMRSLKGLACTSRLWGRFEILYHLCEWGFTFENLGFVMVIYSALFACYDYLKYVFLYFMLLKITMLGSYGLFTVVSHSLCEQRVPSAVMTAWNFEDFECGQTWQTFSMFSHFGLVVYKNCLCSVHAEVAVTVRTEF